MKVFVIVVDGKPHVFTSKGELAKQIKALKLPFDPEVFECNVNKRSYVKKERIAS